MDSQSLNIAYEVDESDINILSWDNQFDRGDFFNIFFILSPIHLTYD